jgi:hypothetical protein
MSKNVGRKIVVGSKVLKFFAPHFSTDSSRTLTFGLIPKILLPHQTMKRQLSCYGVTESRLALESDTSGLPQCVAIGLVC